ncbi:hypothetical protein GCM10011514_21880 [Emticicia aquatilis]|uniref:DUF3592 domain-containing protein n=1 Tax=Emticicia aquatilis TaxID=1537369 RepID=A0A917DPS4_9BACT|nr:DUF3592 domain-containing protein [Emticicia aquatilis]GGD57404.1 hypothetical protein GCM10011514_21880 [Emticicia aquatilis]
MSLPAYTKKPKTFWEKNFASIFIGVGFTLIGITALIFIDQYLFFTKSKETVGKVIGFKVPKNKSLPVPIIEYFTAENIKYEYQHTEGTSPSSYRIGEQVNVYYNPENPTDINLGYSFFPITILLSFGLIFSVFGISFRNKNQNS